MQVSTFKLTAMAASMALMLALPAVANANEGNEGFKHVLLISVDGLHQIDLANCIQGGYCPNLATLTEHGVQYTAALTSAPSDSFPGIVALTTGASTRTAGVFYDVSYDRSLQPPIAGTPYQGGPAYTPAACTPGTNATGTIVEYDEYADKDNRMLESGGLNPDYLPRDPTTCNPVYPHTYLRVNTIFEAVRAAGGYTAWTDKHPAYEILKGSSGHGLNDFYGPEINSNPVDEYNATKTDACTRTGMPIDLAPGSGSQYTDSFKNIQCYDTIHVQSVLNQINGKTHDGKPAQVPTVFGTNFQSVSVGQKLVEKSIGVTGGYLDAMGTPSPALKGEIEYVDQQVGKFVTALQDAHLDRSTLVIIGAKHGQSPVDPTNLLRIPHDLPTGNSPAGLLSASGFNVGNADEDDLSLVWLVDQTQTTDAVNYLETQQANFGKGVIYAGESLKQIFNDPATDPRVPDIFVESTPGVVYTGGGKKVAEHGGFAHYDRAVALIVSNPDLKPAVISKQVDNAQVAPTILRALGISPASLDAVRLEGTTVLPGLFSDH
jgi:Type I phosphodiesterase / nucleotide pyrophosphatase